jgi:hypothetical protein
MIDIREHGGMFGGGKGVKMTKVTASLSEPIEAKEFEVWVKTDVPIGNIFFDVITSETLTTPGEIYIGVSNKQFLPFKDIKVGNKQVNVNKEQSSFPVIAEGDLFRVHGTFLNAFIVESNGKKVLDAFYRLNGQWIQFSFGSDLFIAKIRTATSNVYDVQTIDATDLTVLFEKKNASSSSHPYLYSIIRYDQERGGWVSYGSPNSIYDFGMDLEIVQTIARTNANSINANFIEKGGKYYNVNSESTVFTVYDGLSNAVIKNVAISGNSSYLTGGFETNKEKTRLFHIRRGNGTSGATLYIFDITDIENPVHLINISLSYWMWEAPIYDNYILHASGSSLCSIYKRDFNGNILEVINTNIIIPTSDYNYLKLLGQDQEGNYYLRQRYSFSSTVQFTLHKIAPDGSTVYSVSIDGNTAGDAVMTDAGQIIYWVNRDLSILDKGDGTKLITKTHSYIVQPIITKNVLG